MVATRSWIFGIWFLSMIDIRSSVYGAQHLDQIQVTVQPNVLHDPDRTPSFCLYEEIQLRVQWKAESTTADEIWIGVLNQESGRMGFRMKVPDNSPKDSWRPGQEEDDMHLTTILRCQDDDGWCVPRLISVEIVPHSQEYLLLFSEDTNALSVKSTEEVQTFLLFSSDLTFTGQWLSPRRLLLRFHSANDEAREAAPQTFKLKTRTTEAVPESSGVQQTTVDRDESLSLRLGQAGEFTAQAFHGLLSTGPTIKTNSSSFFVRECAHSTIIHHLDEEEPEVALASPVMDSMMIPFYQMKGIIALSSRHAIRISHHHLPNVHNDKEQQQQRNQKDTGTWSLSFWLYLMPSSTDDATYRTLFYKGQQHAQQHRTPSAWILPHSNHITLRVSTDENPDVGGQSVSEISEERWTFLTFVWTNCSKSCQRHETWRYQYQLYLDGALDTVMNVHDVVMPNDGDLFIGKDHSMEGLRGFLHAIELFDSALDPAEIQRRYEIQRLERMNNPVFPYLRRQYWIQEWAALTIESDKAAAVVVFHADTPACPALESVMESIELEFHPSSQEKTIKSDMRGSLYYQAANVLLDGKCTLKEPHVRFILARKYYQAAAVFGYAPAWYKMALFTATGIGQGPDASDQASAVGTTMNPKELSLYYLAAAYGSDEALVVLGNQYQRESSNEALTPDIETAGVYYAAALDIAGHFYRSRGHQPLHQMNVLSHEERLGDGNYDGQKGEEDAHIQYQRLRAQEGHLESIVAMGDLYYWGARGIVRDHVQALEYFQRASDRGHAGAQAALGGMLLRAEGFPQDPDEELERQKQHQREIEAIAVYEASAEAGNLRALNGLGYLYFRGDVVPVNVTKALVYFEQAANSPSGSDGDSCFNAGFVWHHHGNRSESKNLTKAMEYYVRAAHNHGHFEAVSTLALMHLFEHEVRNSEMALKYLKPAAEAGEWGIVARRGFERYLDFDSTGAAVCYHEAEALGYDSLASRNLAFLYDPRRTRESQRPRASRLVLLGNDRFSPEKDLGFHYTREAATTYDDVDAYVPLGDYYYYGLSPVTRPNYRQAFVWYAKAQNAGQAQGAYNLAWMYEHGQGVPVHYPRALRYYAQVLTIDDTRETRWSMVMIVHLTKARLWLRQVWPWIFTEKDNNVFGHSGSWIVGFTLTIVSIGCFHRWFVSKRRQAS